MQYCGEASFMKTLKEIMIIEKLKKETSHKLLLKRDMSARQKIIYDFLGYELEKLEVLQGATVYALANDDLSGLKKIQLIYGWGEGFELLPRISSEIQRTRSFMNTINKAMDSPKSISFVERRLVQEINKYVVAQARLYKKI